MRDALPEARHRPGLSGRLLVVGIGNRWRGDDAGGLEVAARLRRSGIPVPVLELEGEPLALLDAWAGIHEVILADTVLSGAPAGTVHHLDVSRTPFPATLPAASTHAFGLAETIELARALQRLPALVEIYGVEGRCFAGGPALSPEVERGVETVVAELVQRVKAR